MLERPWATASAAAAARRTGQGVRAGSPGGQQQWRRPRRCGCCRPKLLLTLTSPLYLWATPRGRARGPVRSGALRQRVPPPKMRIKATRWTWREAGRRTQMLPMRQPTPRVTSGLCHQRSVVGLETRAALLGGVPARATASQLRTRRPTVGVRQRLTPLLFAARRRRRPPRRATGTTTAEATAAVVTAAAVVPAVVAAALALRERPAPPRRRRRPLRRRRHHGLAAPRARRRRPHDCGVVRRRRRRRGRRHRRARRARRVGQQARRVWLVAARGSPPWTSAAGTVMRGTAARQTGHPV